MTAKWSETPVRQTPGIGPGIGEDLVALVAALGRVQDAARRPSEAPVALALETGEIEERGCGLPRRLASLSGRRRAARKLRHDGVGPRLLEDAILLGLGIIFGCAEGRVEPGARVGVALVLELADDAPVRTRHVGQDLELAPHQDCQRRRLDAPRRPGPALPTALETLGERPGGVHANEPVRPGPALGGACQAVELLAGPQLVEAGADRVLRHGLEPEPADGLLAAQELDDLAEDELTLAPGVTRVHDSVHVVPGQQLLDGVDAIAVSLLLLERELLRDDGQVGQGPALVLRVDLLRSQQLEEMSHGEGHDVLVVLPIAVMVFEAAQARGDVPRDARLLRDDEGFGQRGSSTLWAPRARADKSGDGNLWGRESAILSPPPVN
jgi:hypothetical protein